MAPLGNSVTSLPFLALLLALPGAEASRKDLHLDLEGNSLGAFDTSYLNAAPCDAGAGICECHTKMVTNLTLPSGQLWVYGPPANFSFYISGAGFAKALEKGYTADLLGCRKTAVINRDCICDYEGKTEQWTESSPHGWADCFKENPEAMCIEKVPEYIKCVDARGETKVWAKRGGRIPGQELGIAGVTGCVPQYSRLSSWTRVWCEWSPKLKTGVHAGTMSEREREHVCESAIPNRGLFNGFMPLTVHGICGYNTKIDKCFNRMDETYMDGRYLYALAFESYW